VLSGLAFLPIFPYHNRTILVLSGLATGASWLCYFRVLKLGNASQVAPIDLSVVFVAVLSALFLGERLSPSNWFGVLLITIGVLLVAM
jgi:transporter family protein